MQIIYGGCYTRILRHRPDMGVESVDHHDRVALGVCVCVFCDCALIWNIESSLHSIFNLYVDIVQDFHTQHVRNYPTTFICNISISCVLRKVFVVKIMGKTVALMCLVDVWPAIRIDF